MEPKEQLLGVGLGFVLGMIEKHWFNGSKWYRFQIPNDLIPYINTTIGAAVGVALPGDPLSGMIAGGIAGAAATGGHQMVKKPATEVARYLPPLPWKK